MFSKQIKLVLPVSVTPGITTVVFVAVTRHLLQWTVSFGGLQIGVTTAHRPSLLHSRIEESKNEKLYTFVYCVIKTLRQLFANINIDVRFL